MLRILHNTNFDIIRWWRVSVTITVGIIALGLISFLVKPLNMSIEFIGGTKVEVEFREGEPPRPDEIRAALDSAGVHGEVQPFGNERTYAIRAIERSQVEQQEAGAESVASEITRALSSKFGAERVNIIRTEAVGPRVGRELARGAATAMIISFAIILIYLAWRFEWRFGVAAIVATAHDILVTVSFIKLMNLEISLTVVAGLLTVVGYSLNDTIIIFDRVRENLRKKRKETLYRTLNRSVNEVLPRSILTHGTTGAAALALLLFAGDVLRPFAWVMTFGVVIVGTLSSNMIASPTLLYIERRWPRDPGDRSGIGARISKESLEDAPEHARR